MARYLESKCKLCRREGKKLFLKGARCYTDKCSYDRRPYPSGQHGQGKSKFSEYGIRLREKQKIKRMYGILESQFSRYFKEADRMKGITGENLLQILETRLDNVIFKIGFATTRNEARQLVRHNHIIVNGKRVNIPSYQVKVGDEIELKEKSKTLKKIQESMEISSRREQSGWLEVDKAKFKGIVKSLPARIDVDESIREQLIVEFYSR